MTSIRQRRRRVNTQAKKLFVLDTNVLMHDPSSLFRFQEHDIFLPMMTLEELDNNKKGLSEVARNARQASRTLEKLISGYESALDTGVPLGNPEIANSTATGRLFLQTQALDYALPTGLPMGKADNQILGVVQALATLKTDYSVILVSKDINIRIKARALGLTSEDYLNDQVIDDNDFLYTGLSDLPTDFWDTHSENMESWNHAGHTYYRVHGALCGTWVVNQLLVQRDAPHLMVRVIDASPHTAVFATLTDYTHPKHAILGITARNPEQSFALNLLLDPDIDFITLNGQAGTGKTLLTLAAAMFATLEKKRYSEIIMTRVTVPVGEDIGFLPGSEEDKMAPWMGALEDNLEVLMQQNHSQGNWQAASQADEWRQKIKIKSLNFMRGRTFLNKFIIIDEAQNLTPKQMKTLITRAGPNTKIVCMGNLAQIDTPYLTEGSSGLTFVVDRFKGWAHYGHITLQRGERSRLADHATEVL